MSILTALSNCPLSTPVQSTTGFKPCWKDSSQLIMTYHHESPATFCAWPGRCDLAGSPWQMADLAWDWHLYHPLAASALPFLCKGCQSQPLLLWFPAPSHPVLLPQLAPYASHMEKCHSPLTLLAAAKSSQVAISLSLLLSLCLSPSPLPTFFFYVTRLFLPCNSLSLFPCLCPSIGIISYMAIKGKMLVLKTWVNRARQWSGEDITSCNHCCCGCWCAQGAG